MNSDFDTRTEQTQAVTATPSADFIEAISRFLDTDPDDLLLELGYYSREDQGREDQGREDQGREDQGQAAGAEGAA